MLGRSWGLLILPDPNQQAELGNWSTNSTLHLCLNFGGFSLPEGLERLDLQSWMEESCRGCVWSLWGWICNYMYLLSRWIVPKRMCQDIVEKKMHWGKPSCSGEEHFWALHWDHFPVQMFEGNPVSNQRCLWRNERSHEEKSDLHSLAKGTPKIPAQAEEMLCPRCEFSHPAPSSLEQQRDELWNATTRETLRQCFAVPLASHPQSCTQATRFWV